MKTLALALLMLAPQENTTPGLGMGQAFPDFLLPDIEGGFGRLSDHRGMKVLVLSFASW